MKSRWKLVKERVVYLDVRDEFKFVAKDLIELSELWESCSGSVVRHTEQRTRLAIDHPRWMLDLGRWHQDAS